MTFSQKWFDLFKDFNRILVVRSSNFTNKRLNAILIYRSIAKSLDLIWMINKNIKNIPIENEEVENKLDSNDKDL
ncbi:MAG: hypothetical protein ACFBSE_23455 [Prochloraceae cyanobacterium]